MKIYISGPMTGIANNNFHAFIEAKKAIEAAGHIAVSPHESPAMDSWEEYMRYDIKMLMDCDAIALLPGWRESRGAIIEHNLATSLDFTIFMISSDNKLCYPFWSRSL